MFLVFSKQHLDIKSFKKTELATLTNDVNIAMVLLERDCPLWLGNSTTHILRHLTEKIGENGPMYASWMFPFKRMNSYITRRANNWAKIEQSIMETIQVINTTFIKLCSYNFIKTKYGYYPCFVTYIYSFHSGFWGYLFKIGRLLQEILYIQSSFSASLIKFQILLIYSIFNSLDIGLYATQSDNFRNVRDIEKTFCKAAEHAFNWDGDVSNKSYIGVKVQPNELIIKERFGDIPTITKHKKLDKISINDEDIKYQLNDVVFCATHMEELEHYTKLRQRNGSS